jgi:hypothetical protein
MIIYSGKLMNIEKVTKRAFTWVLFAFALYTTIQLGSQIYPDFRTYGSVIEFAYVGVAAFDIRKAMKSKSES